MDYALVFFYIVIKYPHSTGLAVRVVQTTHYLLNDAVFHSELNLALRKGKARDVCYKDIFLLNLKPLNCLLCHAATDPFGLKMFRSRLLRYRSSFSLFFLYHLPIRFMSC